jgi:26S proteasome regulatory subunit N8
LIRLVKEKVLGWYSTASRIRPNDIEINELFKKYAPDPVLVTIDVNPVDELGIPTEAYRSVENSSEERTENRKTFVHLPSSVGAFEAEEVGVEHLLRDIRVIVSGMID